MPDWRQIFPDQDYRFQMGLRKSDPARFYAPTADHDQVLAERRRWIQASPEHYLLLTDSGTGLLDETIALAKAWGTLPSPPALMPGSPALRCRWLAQLWEPDFVLLAGNVAGEFHLAGGAVCFPSWWTLHEKAELPVREIHGIVPGLNAALGRQIDQFLARLTPGQGWERANWGLTRTPELNLHPTLNRPRLLPPLRLEEVWVRLEHQSLLVLPQTGGVLFGIRVSVHPLTELCQDQAIRAGLRRALATMEDTVAHYKGLARARDELVTLLS